MRLLVSAGCLLCCLPSSLHAFEARSVAAMSSSKTGFIEYYLGRINPQRIDYGERIEAARRHWVENTIRDLGFWTSLAMFLLCVLGSVIVLHQHQEKNRREIIVANLLAEYHNAWIEAGRRAEEAIARYNDLAKAREQEIPAGRGGLSGVPNSGEESESLTMYLESNFGPPQRRREPRSREGVALAEPDLLSQVRVLQQQLSAASERERNLERELARGPRKHPLRAPSAAKIGDAVESSEKT
jgi:hypothetical protein